MPIEPATAEVATIVQTRTFFAGLAAACDDDVAQVELALSTLAGMDLDEQTLSNFQTVQDDAARAAARCRSTIAVLDDRHRQLEEAVNATPDAARTDFYRDAPAAGPGPAQQRAADQTGGAQVTNNPQPSTVPSGEDGQGGQVGPDGPDGAEPAGDIEAVDRQQVLADRRAKAEIMVPVAELARIAANIADAREDEDADPDRLLDQLLTAVGKATREAGLGDLHPRGASVAYDPEQHVVPGEPPAPGEPIEITQPGLAWWHGGEHLVLGQAWGYRVDADRGAYLVTTPSNLDEEAEHEEAIWLDDDTAAALDLPCYGGPGYYAVLGVNDCEADDEECPAHGSGSCDGRWVELYGADPEQSAVRHFAGDARIIMDCNDPEEQ